MPQKCKLKPVSTGGVFDAPQVIDLPDEEPLVLGRSPLTGIVDMKLSRQHVEVRAKYASSTVQVKQIGQHPACCHGKELEKGATVQLTRGDELQLLPGKYGYSIDFSSASAAKDESSDKSAAVETGSSNGKGGENVNPSKKRALDADGDDNSSPKANDKEPAQKRSRTDGEEGVNAKPAADDIDQKLAALQRKAKEADQKRAAKTSKSKSSQEDIGGGPSARDAGSGEGSSTSSGSTPAADAGKPCTEDEWKEEGKLLVYKSTGVKAGSKIVGFDMDGTLITTASGKVFPVNADDWKIIYSQVPGKLKKLHADGYKVVIFTNQLGISKGKLTQKDFKRKVRNVQRKLGVPLQGFAATAGGMFRKPAMGMWDYLLSKGNDGIKVDMAASMYVGDAAGRPKNWADKKKKDFSCSDRLFALNLGLPFKTPEEFFMDQKAAKFAMPEFDPRKVSTGLPLLTPPSTAIPAPVQEVILLVGYPASGKSTFVKEHLLQHNYVHINRDTMGTWQKCVFVCTSALKKGQSVVIDNTNPDPDSRKRYTQCARKASVQCRCFSFGTTFNHARHNEKFRQLTPSGKDHSPISDMIFYTYKKNYVSPKLEEGFKEIVEVNFVPSFKNDKEEKLYKTFLLEK